jgi:hypothetical protein
MSPEEEGMEEAVDHDDVFVECVPTNDDVFVFLSSLDRSETSVSSSVASSSSSESLRGFSNCPNDKFNHDDGEDDDDDDDVTAYMDTTTNHSSGEDHDSIEQYDFGVDDDVDIGLDVSSSSVDDQESICSLSCSSFEKDNEEEEEDVDTLRRLELPPLDDAVATEESPQKDGGNPIGFAVHVVQNIWEGSKKTPVGFAVNLTEGIFGHLVGMIHSDNREPEANKPPMEEDTRPDDKLFRIEDFEIMRPNIDSAMIAEPDPLDAAEFVLEGTNRTDTSTTSAILLDSELENTDSTACNVSMSMDLFRRLDISINMESSSPQRNGVSDGTVIAFH